MVLIFLEARGEFPEANCINTSHLGLENPRATVTLAILPRLPSNCWAQMTLVLQPSEWVTEDVTLAHECPRHTPVIIYSFLQASLGALVQNPGSTPISTPALSGLVRMVLTPAYSFQDPQSLTFTENYLYS